MWIGPVASGVPPWTSLRARGVRTVYYQTEPFDGCQLSQSAAEELWEFSWHNVDMCGPRLRDDIRTLRYVPLGYTAPRLPISSAAAAAAADASASPPRDLLFFGYPFFKSGRGRCYADLQRALGSRLNATWSLWNAGYFEVNRTACM